MLGTLSCHQKIEAKLVGCRRQLQQWYHIVHLDFPTEEEGVDDCDIERCRLEALHTFWD